MVEPAVRKMSVNVGFSTNETPEDLTQLKVLKTDENGAPLEGCTFQISYQKDGTPKTDEQTTDGNGEALFIYLPLNTDVTIKETAAPEGYTCLLYTSGTHGDRIRSETRSEGRGQSRGTARGGAPQRETDCREK